MCYCVWFDFIFYKFWKFIVIIYKKEIGKKFNNFFGVFFMFFVFWMEKEDICINYVFMM